MTQEDWAEFSEEWFKLCKDEPKWSPRVGTELKDRPRVGMGCVLSKKDVLARRMVDADRSLACGQNDSD